MAGAFSSFHSFRSTTECTHDGRTPRTGLIQATNGNYIGTTNGGGPNQGGVIYEITPAGKLTLLNNFCSQPHCTDSSGTNTPPIQATDGNLYGTAGSGTNLSQGVAYEHTLGKQFSDLYNFCAERIGDLCLDGAGPLGLVQGTDRNFYGTTEWGGTSSLCGTDIGCGVLFELTSTGGYNLLYDFCSLANCTDGGGPTAGVMQATNGMFYGTGGMGGAGSGCNQGFGCGAIYSLSVGLDPFVQSNPTLGKVGRVVNILGNDLTGTTSITFNGISATFKVVSITCIKAMVPSGAATAPIVVTTPNGILNSNVAFQVLP
jgi:uncharacterized repeat protein (TIGR03803 family)